MIGPLLYNRVAKSILRSLVDLSLKGPEEGRRKKATAIFVGEVTDPNGQREVSRLITPEGYTCTALTTVEIMKRILKNDCKTGFQTPSLLYGADFILQFPGVRRENL